MTLHEMLSYGKDKLNKASIADSELDAWLLLEHVLKINRTFYYLHLNEEVEEEKFLEYSKLIHKRSSHVPLQYMTGVQEFMGLEFIVNPSVLIPRQDTELLVEEAGKKLEEGMNILDMCTGSGCILISLLYHYQKTQGMGADISKEALLVAKENAGNHGVESMFVVSDLFLNVNGRFDIIVSNPPYIPSKDIEGLMEEVKNHEPLGALDGFEDGLYFYRRIIKEGKGYLNPGGWLFFEIGYNQAKDVYELMESEGYKEIEVKKDLAGLDRVIFGRV